MSADTVTFTVTGTTHDAMHATAIDIASDYFDVDADELIVLRFDAEEHLKVGTGEIVSFQARVVVSL